MEVSKKSSRWLCLCITNENRLWKQRRRIRKKINTQFQSHCAFLQLSTCRHVQYLQFRKFIQIILCLLSGTSALSEFSMTREMRLLNLYYATTSFFLNPKNFDGLSTKISNFHLFFFLLYRTKTTGKSSGMKVLQN